jgi:rRNA maturation endonuclease Nob1
VLSVLDAYVVAQYRNVRSEINEAERCPSCYRELDAELSFCQWCGTELPLSPDQYRRALETASDGEEGQ